MIVDRELDAVIRAGVFRDRDHAFQEAVETLFTVRPNCARKRPSRCFVRESCRYCGRRRWRAWTSSPSVACFKIG